MSNALGVYYAYWIEDWDSEIEPLMKKAAALNFDLLEVNAALLEDMSLQECKNLRRKMDELGLSLNFCLGLPEDKNVAADDKAVRREAVNYMREIIEKAAQAGGGQISGLIHGAWNIDFAELPQSRDFYLDKSLESMLEMVETAAENEIVLNVEVVNRFEQFLLNTAREAVDYVKEIEHPNLKIHLDTFHMNIEENNFTEAIHAAGDKLGNFHIGENNRKPPGEGGIIDWQKIFTALREIDYDGPVVMEPFIIPGGTIAEDVNLWRDLGPRDEKSLDRRIKQAREFVEKLLKENN